MADKDFKVKNKLVLNGITQAGPLLADSNKQVDAVAFLTPIQGGTGTTTAPSSGQILYSASGTTYAPSSTTVVYPAMSGKSGNFLITNGQTVSWSNIIEATGLSAVGLIVTGAPTGGQTAALQQWRSVNGGTVLASMSASGGFSAVTKSFLIDHPTKQNMKLQYASLEGPENGVYVRGKSKDKIVNLPDYWTGLVDEDSITVQLTAIGTGTVYFDFIANNSIKVGGTAEEFFYLVHAERKDVDKLIVEY